MTTRFAPAPTGLLHLGHVLNAATVWGAARLLGHAVLLRVEDHDQERSRRHFEAAILDDLDWLGFIPDIHPTAAFRSGRCDGRQSDRTEHYRAAADRLRAAGRLYGCACTRATMVTGARSAAGEWTHPPSCREQGLPLGPDVGWRLRLDAGVESFDDLRLGPQAQEPAAQGGDLLIRDRRGHWTYQFAVTVDDWLQSIDLVVRGTDLLESTGRQIRLARMLGRETPPQFLHHGLIMQTATQKLSKSDGATGVRDLRARGWSREEVLAAALRAG
ncbi:MAG: glutamate--tRNA ligase family protein [Vicinamibacterales bacterium]